MQHQYRLVAWVIIDGKAYGPDHDLPVHIAGRITNPRAWPPGTPHLDCPRTRGDTDPGTGDPEPGSEPAPAPVPVPGLVVADVGGGLGAVVAPPRSGKGSGIDAWRAYAASVRVAVAEDADRGDIIAACEESGWAANIAAVATKQGDHADDCVLGILSDVTFLPNGEVDAASGTFRAFTWNPDGGALAPRAYDFTPDAGDRID